MGEGRGAVILSVAVVEKELRRLPLDDLELSSNETKETEVAGKPTAAAVLSWSR